MFGLEKHKFNTAVITDKGETMTYNQLVAIAKEFADAVPQKGLLFCLCENRIGSLVGYVACMEHHIPIVLLDGSKDISVLQNLMTIYQPEYIWISSDKIESIGGETIYKYATFSLQKMQYENEIDKPEINPELALCLTTSGSTGSPKFVRLTAKNVLANAESIAEYLEIDEHERPITTLPSYYSYGVSVINSHLIKGATLLLTEGTVAQREFWNFLKEQKATSISGVPYTYEMLKMLRFLRMDLPYLKTMTQAGGKLNKDIAKEYIEFAKEKGKKFFVMYGQTEATARMSYLPFEHALEKYASIGIAIPRGKFSLIDVNGNPIEEPDVDGELVYIGPNVSLGYAECRADLAKGDENHGELHTGDVARRDSDGFYYITGRMKRFVKVWGNRCNLDATEQMVKSITTSCACVGVDDKITIFVTEHGLEETIIKLLAEKTGFNPKAFEVRIIEAIPVKSSGKIDYPAMQAML
ncbi:MAG: AMP-binding protein [Bacteroidales bacterium]|nr:AMP-binding protein [Bacteroidales bacterium]